MHHTLSQAREKARIFDNFWARRSPPPPVINKDQIQIRAIPQFNTAQLSVAHDRKTSIRPLRFPVTRYQFCPGHLNSLSDHDFGEKGKIIASHHDRQ